MHLFTFVHKLKNKQKKSLLILPRCRCPRYRVPCSKRGRRESGEMQAALVHPTPLITSASDTRAYRHVTSDGLRACSSASVHGQIGRCDDRSSRASLRPSSKCPPSRICRAYVSRFKRFSRRFVLQEVVVGPRRIVNASTSMDRTNFFFDVTQPHLELALRWLVSLQLLFQTRMQSQKN